MRKSWFLFLVLFAGCNGLKDQAQEPAQRKVQDKPYELQVETQSKYFEKQVENFQISLKSKGDWHINEEYPIRLNLKSREGLEFPKEEFGRTDASKFNEDAVVFEIPFSASEAGKYSIEADFSFAVCTKEHCLPDRQTLKAELVVLEKSGEN